MSSTQPLKLKQWLLPLGLLLSVTTTAAVVDEHRHGVQGLNEQQTHPLGTDFEDDLDDEIETEMEEEIEEGLEEEVEEGLEDEIEEGIEDGLEEEMEEGLEEEMEEGLEEEMEDGLEEEMEEGLEEEMEEGLEEEMEDGLEEEMEDGLEVEMENGVEREMEDGLETQMEDGLEIEVEEEWVEEPVEEEWAEEPVEEEWTEEPAEEEWTEEPAEEEWTEEHEEHEVHDEHEWSDGEEGGAEHEDGMPVESEEWAEGDTELPEEEHDSWNEEADHWWGEDEPMSIEDQVFDEQTLIDATSDAVESDILAAVDLQGQDIWTRDWLIFSDEGIEQRLESLGYRYVAKQQLKSLGQTLAKVTAPATFSLDTDYAQVLAATNYADHNHIYRYQRTEQAVSGAPLSPAQLQPVSLGSHKITLGMIDTAVDTRHPALKDAKVRQRSFVASGKNQPTGHGTEVAGILMANAKDYRGLLPGARLYNASVFFEQGKQGRMATTESLLKALDWLASLDVKVINMSLSGPPNRLLSYAIDQLCQRDILVVAAVGNAGPLSAPLYPAAYPCTVAVTAHDKNRRIYRQAVLGEHVDAAAFGVNLTTLKSGGGYQQSSGTSLATPFVSAWLAAQYASDKVSSGQSQNWLSGQFSLFEDLGASGRDPVYGHGALPKSAGAAPSGLARR